MTRLQWRLVNGVHMSRLNKACFLAALTGMEIITKPGEISRDPSAVAYTTENTNVLSHRTSRTRKDIRKKDLLETDKTKNKGVMISTTLHGSVRLTFHRVVSGVEVWARDYFLFFECLFSTEKNMLVITEKCISGNNNRSLFDSGALDSLTGVYWLTVAFIFPAATCFPFGLQQTGWERAHSKQNSTEPHNKTMKQIHYVQSQLPIPKTGCCNSLNFVPARFDMCFTHCMWCLLTQEAQLVLWQCQWHPKSSSGRQIDRQPAWIPVQDSTSGPALKFQVELLAALMQKVTSVVSSGKKKKDKKNFFTTVQIN